MRSQIPVPSRQTNTKTITGCGGKIRHSAAVWRNLDDSVKNSHCMQLIFVSIFKIVSTLTSLDNAMTFAFMLLHAAVWRKFSHLMEIYFHSDFNYSRMRISIPKHLPEQTHFGWGTATQNGMRFTKIVVKQL